MSSNPPIVGTSNSCPHCAAENPLGSSFCQKCGKALPSKSGPRIIEGDQFAKSAGGRQLQSDELRRKARAASGALLAVAILMTLGLVVVFLFTRELFNDPLAGQAAMVAVAAQAVVAFAYWGLWIWSRSNPLPAAIVGLVVFLSLMAVNALASGPQSLAQGLFVKIIIIAVLARAIQAGVNYRALQQQAT